MAGPDPATTEWVPVWNPIGPNVAFTNVSNVFTPVQHFNAGLIERLRSVPLGEWIDVPYFAEWFSADAPMVWTVIPANIVSNTYSLNGRTYMWNVKIGPSTLSGTPGNLIYINFPNQFPAAKDVHIPCQMFFGATGQWTTGHVTIYAGTTWTTIYKQDFSNFALGDLHINFQLNIFFSGIALNWTLAEMIAARAADTRKPIGAP